MEIKTSQGQTHMGVSLHAGVSFCSCPPQQEGSQLAASL